MPYKDKDKQKEFQRNWYKKNKDKSLLSSNGQKFLKRKFIAEYKNKPCMDCGYSYPYYVMDLDHRDNVDKLFNISTLAHNISWKQLKEEINKCDVVCSNCHRERTAKQFGWYKAKYISVV